METAIVNETVINYKFQTSQQDRAHLVVIFSGFRKKGTFDFGGSTLKNLGSNILWIDDSFYGKYSYYIRANGGLDISSDIHLFIFKKLEELGLTKNECTLAGFSKGGSAALYFLSKFDFNKAVVAVPQFSIGRYITTAWSECLLSMTRTGSSVELEELDSLIPAAISMNSKDKNVYLFTSPSDIQYETEIVPNLELLRQFKNFNYIITQSPLVTQHNQITKYNVPSIISILSLLTEGFTPRIGEVKNGAGAVMNVVGRISATSDLHVSMNNIFMRKGRLFLTGYGLFDGMASDKWGSQKNCLQLESGSESIEIPLGQIVDESVNARFYAQPFVNYSHASFATIGHKGINLEKLPEGSYKAGLSVSTAQRKQTGFIFKAADSDKMYFHHDRVYRIQVKRGTIRISVRNLARASHESIDFLEVQTRLEDDLLYVKGYLVPHHEEIDEWDSIHYFVNFENIESSKTLFYKIANDSKSDMVEVTGNSLLDQSKAFYATKGYRGLDISSISPGSYRLRIIGVTKTRLISSPVLGLKVLISDGATPVIDVVGSSVSSELFRPDMSDGWKGRYVGGAVSSPMSLISLMSCNLESDGLIDDNSNSTLNYESSRSLMSKISNGDSEFIIIDLFTDACLGVVGNGRSWLVDNRPENPAENAIQGRSGLTTLSMLSNEDQYLELFREACERFADSIHFNSPHTTILLNSSRCVSSHRNLTAFKNFNRSKVDQLNRAWDLLEKVFRNVVPCRVLEVEMQDILGDTDHPSGSGFVHYENEYYRQLNSLIVSELGKFREPDQG